MELKYYIGDWVYFVDGGQFVEWADDYYFSTDYKTCYGFDAEGNYYEAKRIDAVSPLITFEQKPNNEVGFNMILTTPGEKPQVTKLDSSMFSVVDYDHGFLFVTNHMRQEGLNGYSSFDIYATWWNPMRDLIGTPIKIGKTSEFWCEYNGE